MKSAPATHHCCASGQTSSLSLVVLLYIERLFEFLSCGSSRRQRAWVKLPSPPAQFLVASAAFGAVEGFMAFLRKSFAWCMGMGAEPVVEGKGSKD